MILELGLNGKIHSKLKGETLTTPNQNILLNSLKKEDYLYRDLFITLGHLKMENLMGMDNYK